MNTAIQSLLPGAGCVAAGFVFAWLAMRLWSLLHPTKPATRQFPNDKTTAAAAQMVAAAHNIQDRIHEAEVNSAEISEEELTQLARGMEHLSRASKALALHGLRTHSGQHAVSTQHSVTP